ncbi:hypothetical protein [Tenacibaculum jejuense]|jgi:hypothetical protein|uniref:hypothetical protein n=1 Tax=Tenacibaculum jejuense TaxID=584609 RepID=UPI0012FD493C|nr:hypothetical protein [Tenacibaculum jejuense]
MKKISNLNGVKILTKKELSTIEGAVFGGTVCRGNRCYLSLPTGEFFVGYCRFGSCTYV